MTSIILIRKHHDGQQSYAGMFDSDSQEYHRDLARALMDTALTVILLEHDKPLPPITHAEVNRGI